MSSEHESLEWTEEFALFIVVLIVVMCCCMKLLDTCKICGVSVLNCVNFLMAMSIIGGSFGSLYALKRHWETAHAVVTTIANSTTVDSLIQLTAYAIANSAGNGAGVPVAEGG